MSDINKLLIVGRIVRPAETKITSSGIFIANFSIATSRSKKNDDNTWGKNVYFFNLALFGRRAENIAKYLIQGQQVLVEGHLVQKKWEINGTKQSKMEIEIEEITLLPGKIRQTLSNCPEIINDEIPFEEEFSIPGFTDYFTNDEGQI